MSTPIPIIMRSHNDMPFVVETFDALARQTVAGEVIVFDNASTDGTREVVAARAARVIDVPAGAYMPGVVLNDGMVQTIGPLAVFLNADCTPQHDEFLAELVAPMTEAGVAATFARQIPRPDCHPLFAKDTDTMFGDGCGPQRGRHRFSMAASCIRRAVWHADPFNEHFRYSEDVEWTWRARLHGYAIRYVPDAVAMHSNSYTLRQLYRRHFGEGFADAEIFHWTPWQASLVRYSLLPYVRLVLSDLRYCLRHGHPGCIITAPLLRLVQAAGRRAGFTAGRTQQRAGA